MKRLGSLFERLRPGFEKGGRLHVLSPVFDAAETFFFSPPTVPAVSPHIRDPLDNKRFMVTVIVALLPCLLAGVYFFGLRVLTLVLVSYVVGGAAEVVFAIVRKDEIKEGFLVTGLIFPLMLPPTVPLWMAAVGILFGVVVGKELFGGTGRNLFNPALVGRCFLAIGYPDAMTTNTAFWVKPGTGITGRLFQYVDGSNVSAVTQATPLVGAKEGVYTPLADLLFGNVAGSVGETSALMIVAAGVFLLLTRVANWRTVASTVLSFAILAALMHWASPESFGPVVWHLLAGSLLFGAFFVATDPVTSPVSNPAKWAYGIVIGVSTILIRNLTSFSEGVMYAILLGNIFAPVFDEVVFRARIRRLRQ